MGHWKVKCQADNTWSKDEFSPCITCPPMWLEVKNVADRDVTSQKVYRKNLLNYQFFCGDSSNWLGMKVKFSIIFSELKLGPGVFIVRRAMDTLVIRLIPG